MLMDMVVVGAAFTMPLLWFYFIEKRKEAIR